MIRLVTKRHYLAFFVMIMFVGACSSTGSMPADPDAVLQQISAKECSRGFIRPPGVRKCLNLTDLYAGRIRTVAPIGMCPPEYKRQQTRGYCLPKFTVVACGKQTFACDRESNDLFRVKPGPFKCPEGTIVVSVDAPLFDENGALFLGTRTAVSCAPPSKIDPV